SILCYWLYSIWPFLCLVPEQQQCLFRCHSASNLTESFALDCCSNCWRVAMLNTKILNPDLLSLLARVRHTNSLVIADRGFPFWPQIETIDISLTDDVPTVLQVLATIRHDFHPVNAYMAREFLQHNSHKIRSLFAKALEGIPTTHEPHVT